MGRMSIVFYKEIGFSKGQIAIYSKGLGWITTVVFTLLGGVMAMRAGTIKTMFFAGGLMAITNLLFAVLAWTGKSEILFAIAVIADGLRCSVRQAAWNQRSLDCGYSNSDWCRADYPRQPRRFR